MTKAPALDHHFGSDPNIVRLTAHLRRGWRTGRFGPYFDGTSTFDWRFGYRCRAARLRASATPGTPSHLEFVEQIACEQHHARGGLSWRVADGVLTAQIPLFVKGDREVTVSPLLTGAGFQRLVLRHVEYLGGTGRLLRVDQTLWLDLDHNRRPLVDWQPGSGMPSAGLPSLGKRRP